VSDVQQHSPPARDVKTVAAKWLERQDRPDWGAADQAELDAWLAQSNANLIAYWRVRDAWSRAERLVAVGKTVGQGARTRLLPTRAVITGIAAVLVAALGLTYGAQFIAPKPRERTFATPLGGREIVNFADGSSIELNTNTVLRTRMTTQERTIWLVKGEAFFQVKHDPAHPFVVYAGHDRVTDLGTEFVMRRDPDRLEVALLKGRVRVGEVDARAEAQSTLLMPGDVATSTATSMFVTQEPMHTLATSLSWRRGVLVFDKTPLADAAEEFNRYNRLKLVIADPAIASITVDGTFPANNVEAFTDVAQHILALHVVRHGDNIVISR
jgi:transmembrane sensor